MGRTISLRFDVEGERTPGLELVEQLLADSDLDHVEMTPEIAEQAIDAFESLRFPGLFEEIIESGEHFAKQVHSEATRGLQEVVQNADDQRAENIRFGFRRRSGRSELLIAHDGNPVEIGDVMRMALPLLSGSRADPDKIGRFGIGLKTLNQLGDRLAVHCPPVPGFEIRGGRISRLARTAAPIRGFWDPSQRETLFVLRLEREEFDWAFFQAWLQTWDASSLLFLRSLRCVTLTNLSSGRQGKTIRCGLDIGRPETTDLKIPKAPPAQRVTMREIDGRRRWTRYSLEYPRPRRLKATNKESGDTVKLQVAIPGRSDRNRIHVGLPLEEPSTLPYSFSAPFDPNVERTKLRDNNALNEWLIERIGDLVTAISLQRFAESPRSGWGSVPLATETAGESPWASERIEKMVARQRRRVAEKVVLTLPGGAEMRLARLNFEHPEFDGLIDPERLDLLWVRNWEEEYGERRALPRAWRDAGRWRAFLTELEGTEPLTASECLTILDWPDAELPAEGAKWLVAMVDAGLRAGEEEALWKRRCVALADDGGRLSPAEIEEQGTLLVHKAPKRGDLAADLNLAQPIARSFKARQEAAGRVRGWLSRRGVLRERASDQDALRALSRARLDDPIDLRRRDKVLQRLRNSFEKLPSEQRERLGEKIGTNLGLAGHSFEKGEKAPVLARLSEAYLPSAIDKNAGWPTAAGQTPGLVWIDRRYSDLLRSQSRGGGALSFLRALGAAVAPRLVAAPPPSTYTHATKLKNKRDLSAQHRDELAAHPLATGLRDDWRSPDLDAVVADLVREKRATHRRKRAQALFLALDRGWSDLYERRATATAVHHRYSWQTDGEVSATWVAKLASAPWLSTQEPRFRSAPPRDLTVLTKAAYEIEGEDLGKYAYEIEEKHVDSPVVDALEIQGRPRASSIVAQLESLRQAEVAGEEVHQAWVDHCYKGLASYVPGGPYGDRSDLTPAQLKRAFTTGRGSIGLIRSGDRWLVPNEVRRGSFLGVSLGWVDSAADPLWDFLGVQSPSAADCVSVLTGLAETGEGDARSSEVLAFRRLLELQAEGKLKRSALRELSLRLHGGPRRNQGRVFAVANPAVAAALGEHWPTWNPPLPLAELAPLLPLLGLETIDEADFAAEIPGHLAAGSFEVQDEFFAATGHFQDYLALHHPTLHQRLTASQWAELRSAHVIAGPGWKVRVRAKGRRPVLLGLRAHLFRDPLRLCLAHETEVADTETGGAAIAGFVVGDEEAPEERSTLALAWAYAYSIRSSSREEISISAPASEAQDRPPPKSFDELMSKRAKARSRRKNRAKSSSPPPPPPRELVDLDEPAPGSGRGHLPRRKATDSAEGTAEDQARRHRARQRQPPPAKCP